MKAYLEISCLILDDNWTGIPLVAAALANQALADEDDRIEWGFLFETIPLPKDLVRNLLIAQTGRPVRAELPDLLWRTPPLAWRVSREAAAIFPNMKPVRRYFKREAMVIHDLSTLLFPHFHKHDAVNHYANRFLDDVASTGHFFCNSSATREDLKIYLGVEHNATSIIPFGIDLKWEDVSAAQRIGDFGKVEPYVAVVGTLEPRKNGRIVIEFLAKHPDFAKRNRIVFIGRDGWLDERRKIYDQMAELGIPADRVVFTGFVSEREKITLMYHSRFCIYPSFFEGFGLPVLEAAVLGKNIVCSNSSSMPEVAPDKCYFFDPNSLTEFARAMRNAERGSEFKGVSRSLEDVMSAAAKYNWSGAYEEVKRWVLA
ncbi:MAG: glycosyltransferase family 4 protein [Roseomonas sp.]|nr:glycosyltransferase family 4 protein [Roseomonas sp.]